MLILCIASVSILYGPDTKPNQKFWACRTILTPYLVPYRTGSVISSMHIILRHVKPYHTTSNHTELNRTESNRIGLHRIVSAPRTLYYTLYSTNGLELRYESSNQGKKKRESEWVSRYVTTNQARMVNIQHDDDDDGMKYEIRNTKYEYSI